ncbi:MAG: ferrochelatase [Desulfobulbaceae bacterium]|uniref:Ferrochelatase n=1 Tax=Candidatus Desulfatifera sulfidica TaxID=2841691 RepID=A0A8J6TEA0_9BACT|nr:ferrochelatase [Candidatus Desulfatifera sulfidica]
MSKTHFPVGVILLNMGGPERLDDVAPFLYNLFSDREIIQLGPRFMQKPLAWFISRRRAPKSKKTYEQIGGGSPLTRITLSQETALQDTLNKEYNFQVVTAMRYWQPRSQDALGRLNLSEIQHLIALPLYPHYSRATNGSSLNDLKHSLAKTQNPPSLHVIDSWPTQPSYIEALSNKILAATQQFNNAPFQVVYSAHSLPVSFINEGDPYVEHIQQTIQAVEARTHLPGRLCFQSRSGPVEWLAPSTPDMLQTLASEGCRNILMVPISFVSDHVETLYEIDMLYREQARTLGMRLESSASLNTDPVFIRGLKELILEKNRETLNQD